MAEEHGLVRVEAIAAEALKLAQQAVADGQAHVDVCEQVRRLNEANQKTNERFQDEMRNKFDSWSARTEDSLKLIRESLNINQQAVSDRTTELLSEVNLRQSNAAQTIVASMNNTLSSFKDFVIEGLKTANRSAEGTNAALAAFIHSQTETNKLLSEKATGAAQTADKALDRNWQIGAAVLVMAVTSVVGLVAAYGQAKKWW